jgi:FtrD-like iron-sulfur protein
MAQAFTAALLVLAEAALAGALLWAFAGPRLPRLAWSLAAAPAAGALAGLATGLALSGRPGLEAEWVLPLLRARLVTALLLLAATLAWRGRAAADPLPASRPARAGLELLALAAALVLSLPEGVGLGLALRDAAVLAGSWGPAAGGAALGLGAAALLGTLAGLALRRTGAGEHLAPAALAALLFALEISGLAATGAQQVQLGLGLAGLVGRFIHDAIHLGFVTAQLPDHPFLKDGVYQLILALLEPGPHALIAWALLALPPFLAWRAAARRPAPEDPAASAPARRVARARWRLQARLCGAACAVAVAVTGAAILSAQGQAEALYEPVPEPAVDDGAGTVVVPLGGPLGGSPRMRKFAWSSAGRTITFFTVPRPDGRLAVALDLCEVCQPKGYAQLGAGFVFCKYCKTPIPVETVGQAGGCNPIPVPSAVVDGAVLRIPAADLRRLHERALEVIK